MLTSESHGQGSGVVLVHGTGSSAAFWAPVVDDLAREHTVVVPDLPGSGGSPLPEGPLDLDQVADEIVATAERAGLDRFALVGMSMGAAVAVRVARRQPARVTRLALLAGYAVPRAGLRLRFDVWASLLGKDDDAAAKLLVTLSSPDHILGAMSEEQVSGLLGWVRSGQAPGVAAQLELARTLDVRQDLGHVTAPTLVMAGDADPFVEPSHSLQFVAGIRGARLETVRGGGHGFILEQPEHTMTVLVPFPDR
ncbi:hypothetical protein BJF78_00920 [Pseudonocardia sp. CNS-139]|nr:hypothetical protein BJF78_00920 [Pseudonocardia sp. CNS-139]